VQIDLRKFRGNQKLTLAAL